jgi:hypothetical protein
MTWRDRGSSKRGALNGTQAQGAFEVLSVHACGMDASCRPPSVGKATARKVQCPCDAQCSALPWPRASHTSISPLPCFSACVV